MSTQVLRVAVVIPCYRVRNHILAVIEAIGPEVEIIYVIDDCCPDHSGQLVQEECQDSRVTILQNSKNLGVGGAVKEGYRQALADGIDIVVKIDGDGQMNPELIPIFLDPILNGEADYTKGNRFFDLEMIHAIPRVRLFGNAILSFVTKLSSGYWNLFDPTNGYTAIHTSVASHLPLDKISNRYFFETDMLFRLNTLRALVVDIPMAAKYGDEESNLKIRKLIGSFLFRHSRNFWKRIFYNYYLRDMSLGSIELPLGGTLLVFGVIHGSYQWWVSTAEAVYASAGTVMLSALPVIIGLQLLLGFLSQDIQSVPQRPFHRAKSYLKKNRTNHG